MDSIEISLYFVFPFFISHSYIGIQPSNITIFETVLNNIFVIGNNKSDRGQWGGKMREERTVIIMISYFVTSK